MRDTEQPAHAAWLARAVDLAVDNVAHGGGPFGALVVYDGALVATGFDDRRFSEPFSIPPTEWPTPARRLAVTGAHAPFEAWAAKADRVPY